MVFKALFLVAYLLATSAYSAPQCSAGQKLSSKCPGMVCNEPVCGDKGRVACLYQQQCPEPHCECARPFVRNGTGGGCIARKDCPADGKIATPAPPKCGFGEKLNKCPGTCNERACGDKGHELCVWKPNCPPPQCECAYPFVRNGTGGACIKRSECPPWLGTDSYEDDYSDEDDFPDERPQKKKGKVNGKGRQSDDGKKKGKNGKRGDDSHTINTGLGCNVIIDIVYESDGTSHPLSESDKKKLDKYADDWVAWGDQISLSESDKKKLDDNINGRGPPPKAPVMPCICKTCKKRNGGGKGRDDDSIAPSGKAPKCAVGETLNRCPGMCNEPACGDDGQLFCVSKPCPPPACTCALSYVRNGTGGACIKRSQCPGGGKEPIPDSYEDDDDSEENSQKKKNKGKEKGKGNKKGKECANGLFA